MGDQSETSDLQLEEEISFETIHILRERLASIAGNEVIRIDGSQTMDIHTAGLQLLLAFKQYTETQGKTFNWLSPSYELVSSATVIGLADALQLEYREAEIEVAGQHDDENLIMVF